MREKLIVPLGRPKRNGGKFFATEELLERTRDRKWLVKMTEAIRTNWADRNGDTDEDSGDKPNKLAA
jgi:hypothetical protein